MWQNVGEIELDRQLSEAADLYLAVDAGQRGQMRESVGGETWDLVVYVRRLAVLVLRNREGASQWLRRGLAIAALENARFDDRDFIVSLVILRWAADKVGLVTRNYFLEAEELFQPDALSSLRNARDYQDPGSILISSGPPGWYEYELP